MTVAEWLAERRGNVEVKGAGKAAVKKEMSSERLATINHRKLSDS